MLRSFDMDSFDGKPNSVTPTGSQGQFDPKNILVHSIGSSSER